MSTRCVSVALVCGLSATALAQSSVRAWGQYAFDTDSRRARIVGVAAGDSTTAVIRSDGRLFVQGADSLWLSRPPAAARFVAADLDVGLAVGLQTDGTVSVWGAWANGFVGAIPALPAGLHYTAVAVGAAHVLLLRSDGTAVAAGINGNGQCNVPPLPPGVHFVAVDANGYYSIGLLSDGTLRAWGDNTDGQCNVPTAPPGVSYSAVACGRTFAVALRSDGVIDAWGSNMLGEQNVPPLPSGLVYVRCAAGHHFALAERSDGALVGWGSNSAGQVDCPAAPTGRRCLQLAAGGAHGVACWSDGSVSTWGVDGFVTRIPAPDPGDVVDTRFVGIAAGVAHTLCVRGRGFLESHGAGAHGQASVPSGARWVAVAAGGTHSLALHGDGRITAFGDPADGRCAVPALPAGVAYTAIDASQTHSVAVRSDGEAVAFGSNIWGQCNLPPSSGVPFVAGGAGDGHTLLLRADGTLVHAGQQSSGWANPANVPLPAGLRYVQVSAGRYLHGAIRSDGEAVLWAIGPTLSSVPPLPWGVSYVEVDCGDSVAWLRRSDGRIVVIGDPTLLATMRLEAPALDHGQSYVALDATSLTAIAEVGRESRYVSFATGCAGSAPVSRLVPRDTPRIGAACEVTLFDLPIDVALFATGWQRLPSGVDLGSLGMPGCDLHVSPDIVVPLAGTGGQARWSPVLPMDPAWIGRRFYQQALVLDPAAGNPAGAVLSAAAEAVVGDG